MRSFKARLGKLEKNIKPKKKLYKIYWADGTLAGEYWTETLKLFELMWWRMLIIIYNILFLNI